MKTGSIFVQIASYRDPDCKNTIRDLFKKAKYPQNIFIGLNWQYSPEDDFEPFYSEDEYSHQIRIVKHDCTESKGVCWARSKTQLLYKNETYTLQIDAHMRFIEYWDEELIKMYQKLQQNGIKKPIISHYPPNFTLDGKYDTRQGKMTSYIREDGIVYFKLSGYSIEKYDDMPLPSASVAGGFIFANGSMIKEIPYDPNLYFHGEEITLSTRLWTNGWDIFNPTKIITYHLYQSTVDKESGKKVKVRDIKLHKDDNNNHKELEKNSVQRIKYLLETQPYISNVAVTKDLEHFGLGNQRSLYQYENYSGINFKQLHRNHFARLGIFFNDITPTTLEDEINFLTQFNTLKSSLETTDTISLVLKKFNINRIIGIKDHQISKSFDDSSFSYIGIDYLQKNIDYYRYTFRQEPNKIFYQQNILRESLPNADAILCFDFFNVTPISFGWQLLTNIRKNSIQYLLASEVDILINIYSLPNPILLIPYKDTYLGLWDCQKILIYLYCLNQEYAGKRLKLIPLIEEKLNNLEKIFNNHKLEYKEIMSRLHQNLNSSFAREILETPNIKTLLSQNNNLGTRLIDDILRIRFWSNENRLLEEFSFINAQDKQFVLALINEYLQNYEERLSI